MSKETVAIINPKRRHRKRAAATPEKRQRGRRAKRNDGLMTVTANPKRRRQHRGGRRRGFFGNPGDRGLKIGIDSIAYTAGAAIAAKLVPTLIPKVKDYNKGFIGYGLQAAVGGILYVLLDKLLKQKKAAQYVLLGTGVSLVTTILDDFWFKKQAATIKGLGFYPDEELSSYSLDPSMQLSGDLGVVIDEEGNVIDGLGNYEDVPLDQQMLGLDASTFIRPRIGPAIRPQVMAPAAARPAANGFRSSRLRSRW